MPRFSTILLLLSLAAAAVTAAPCEDTATTTMLWQMISQGRADDLQQALENDASLATTCAADGRTGLHWANEYNQKAMYDMLVAAGADENAKDVDGNTAKQVTNVGPTQNAPVAPEEPSVDSYDTPDEEEDEEDWE